jgi:hypothetical protein
MADGEQSATGEAVRDSPDSEGQGSRTHKCRRRQRPDLESIDRVGSG